MKTTLSRISPFGIQVPDYEGRWINVGKGKFQKVKNLSDFSVGDEVEANIEENGEYLNLLSLKLASGSQPAANGDSAAKPSAEAKKAYAPKSEDPKRQLMIIKQSVISSVLLSPLLADQLSESDISEAVSQVKGLTEEFVAYVMSDELKFKSQGEAKA